MIRLRTAGGVLIPLPVEAAAVEICSTDGKLARLLLPRKDGTIVVLDPDDADFKAYARAVSAEVAELITFKS